MTKKNVARLKLAAKILGVAVAILSAIIAIVINVIVTPEKLTPIVLRYAHQYLDADVKIGSVEITFFSSFPRFGVKVTDAEVVSHAFHKYDTDTLIARRDTLARIGQLRAGLDLMHTLVTGDIIIGRVGLRDSQIRLHTDSLGRSNWDILISDTTGTQTDTTASSTNVELKHVRFHNVRIAYADKVSQVYCRVDSLNLQVDGTIGADEIDFDFDLDDRKTSVKVDDIRILRRMPMALNGHIAYNFETQRCNIDEAAIAFDGHAIDLDGWVQTDTFGTNIDIKYGIDSPSVQKLFSLIPKDIVGEEIVVEDGTIEAHGFVNGRFDEVQKPIISCNVAVENVKGHYEGMKQGIDDLTAQFNALIDAQRPDSSYVNLEIFHFKGGKSEVESVVKMTQLLTDANISAKINAHADLGSLTDVFPIANTEMYGVVDADLSAQFHYSDIRDRNFGRIRIRGKFDADSIAITNDTLAFSLRSDAHLRFDGNDTLKIGAKVKQFVMQTKSVRVRVSDFKTRGKTLMQGDTTQIVPVQGEFKAGRIGFKMDTLAIFAKNVSSSALIRPMKENKRFPHMEASINADTVFSRIWNVRGFTQNVKSSAMLERTGDSTWNSDLSADVLQVRVKMPFYQLPIIATNTRLSQAEKVISIDHSHIRAGQTSVNVSAKAYDLFNSLYRHKNIRASLDINADTINCNELIAAYIPTDTATLEQVASQIDTTYIDVATPDSTFTNKEHNGVIEIPEKIRFSLNTNIKTLLYDKLVVDDIRGSVEIVNGCLHMTHTLFKYGNSRAISIMAYKGDREKQHADVDAFIHWERADIGNLITDLSLDTIMPMMQSFKGKIDCYMTVKTELDSLMMPNVETSQISMHMGGKKLVLLDGETFAKLSKILMFKNKKENIIDTLSFNVLVDSGKVTVLPFVANIDRYSAVIGGEQDLNMNMNYHVSILKSPLPFKAGVTITGTPSNLDFDITTAKLKKKAKADEQAKNDAISLQRRINVIRDTYLMSGLSMPKQLMSEQERQQAEMEERMRQAVADAESDEESEEEPLIAVEANNDTTSVSTDAQETE